MERKKDWMPNKKKRVERKEETINETAVERVRMKTKQKKRTTNRNEIHALPPNVK